MGLKLWGFNHSHLAFPSLIHFPSLFLSSLFVYHDKTFLLASVARQETALVIVNLVNSCTSCYNITLLAIKRANFKFLTARCYAERGIAKAIVCPSARPSACL